MAGEEDEDERSARAKKKRAKEPAPDSASAPPSGDVGDEASSIESPGAVREGEKAKRKWSLDDVVAALRTRPRQLEDGTVHVNDKLLRALAKVGARAVPAVLEVLKDDNWLARWAALAALQRIALQDPTVDPKLVLPPVVEALGDKKARVRARAVEALAAVRKSKGEVLAGLIKALGDSDAEVSRLAVMHVLELGLDPKELTDKLVAVITTKRSVYLRVGALTVLLHLGKAAKPAVPYLIELLEDPAAEVREYANLALTAIRTPSMRLQVIRTASMRLKAVEDAPKDDSEDESDEDSEEESEASESEAAPKKKKPGIRRRRPRRRF